LLGRLPGPGELVQGPLTVKVLHRGDAAGVDVRAQVSPEDELLQGRGELLVVIGPELGGHVLGPQVDDEAFLGPREGTQQAAIKAGVRDAQVRERLRLALAACRLRGSANHDYIVPHATDNIGATRAQGAACRSRSPRSKSGTGLRDPSPAAFRAPPMSVLSEGDVTVILSAGQGGGDRRTGR
jgi:hypothetical protein